MEQRRFGRTNLNVSILGYGAAPAAFLASEQQRTAAIIGSLLDAGMNLIDTAAMYPGSEKFIGDHLAHRRKDYVLVSKCGTKVDEIDARPWSRELVAKSVDRALRLMKTDVLDVMLLHSCDLATLQKGEALDELVKARDAGKIRFAGYSGDNDAAAYAAAHPDVAVLETSVSVADQANVEKVFPLVERHDVGVIAKRPIANAAWKDLSAQPGMYKNYAKDYTERLKKMALDPRAMLGRSNDNAAAAAGEALWPELALRFTLSFPQVSTAIIGTTNPENARANIAHAAKGPLPGETVEALRAAFRRADPEGKWPGLT
jgi:aryl-alcohol dehydrogenase-like predicted oxidoreductase